MVTNAKSTSSGLSATERDTFLAAISEKLAIGAGRGSKANSIQTILSEHDRFGNAPIQINAELPGFTFFTRPRFNFTTTSLRQDRHLAMLDGIDPQSLMFSIRCNLDTVFARSNAARASAEASPWINTESPFNIPLSNTLVGIQGWPDINIESETTEPGYFSEDMTFSRGSDRGRRTYDVSCTFRDPQGGYVMAMLFYWLHAMALQMEGITVAYPEDREANRLNYTVSIYRFVMDPSMRTIVKWCKGTGCYPTSIPIGEVFNFGPGDSYIHTSQQFTVPFKVNHVSYMDPIHLRAFNTLVERYCKDIDNGTRVNADSNPHNNFAGIPYIDIKSENGTNELMWRVRKDELVSKADRVIEQLSAKLSDQTKSILTDVYTKTP